MQASTQIEIRDHDYCRQILPTQSEQRRRTGENQVLKNHSSCHNTTFNVPFNLQTQGNIDFMLAQMNRRSHHKTVTSIR